MKKHFYSNSEGFLTHRPPEKIQKIINFNNNILYRNNLNKNEMTDKEGLNKAYNESKKIYVNPNNKTMYIAGTSSFQDVYDDLKIPLKLTKYSQRYQDVEKVLRNNNNSIDILVGHSLGSSVGLELNKNKYYKFKTIFYSSPVFDLFTNKSVNDSNLRFKTNNDLISMFDRNAINISKPSINPLSLHSYENYGNTGSQLGKQII